MQEPGMNEEGVWQVSWRVIRRRRRRGCRIYILTSLYGEITRRIQQCHNWVLQREWRQHKNNLQSWCVAFSHSFNATHNVAGKFLVHTGQHHHWRIRGLSRLRSSSESTLHVLGGFWQDSMIDQYERSKPCEVHGCDRYQLQVSILHFSTSFMC